MEKEQLKITDNVDKIINHFGYEKTLENTSLFEVKPQNLTPINALIFELLMIERKAAENKNISVKYDYDANSKIGLLQYSITNLEE